MHDKCNLRLNELPNISAAPSQGPLLLAPHTACAPAPLPTLGRAELKNRVGQVGGCVGISAVYGTLVYGQYVVYWYMGRLEARHEADGDWTGKPVGCWTVDG